MAVDQDSLNLLFGRFRPELVKHAHILLHRAGVPDGRMSPDDVVQIVLLKAYQNWDACRAANGDASVRSWLLTTLSNEVLNACRDLHRGVRDIGREWSLDADAGGSNGHVRAEPAAEQSSPSERMRVLETLEGLRAAIEHLPEDLKVVVDPLSHGFNLRDIAAQLGLSRGKVARRLTKALPIMSQFLREGGHDSRRAD